MKILNKKMEYKEFLNSKTKVVPPTGIQVDRREFHHSGKPHQNDIIEWALERGAALIAPDTGLGKGQPIGSKVLTPSGWTEIQDLKIGDYIISSKGKPEKVKGVFPKNEIKTYKITFSDKSSFVVDEDHLHIVRSYNDRSRLKDWKVMDTKSLLNKPLKQGQRRIWEIPIVLPVQFAEKQLPIDPYILGTLIGDGCIKQAIHLTNPDDMIIDKIKSLLPSGYSINCRRGIDYTITSNVHGINEMTNSLREMKLFGKGSTDKFIPKEYLFASISQRIELLRGLMDTDGYASDTCQYYTTSEQLSNDVIHLIRSLGGIPTKTIKISPAYTYKDEKKNGKDCYIITFSLNTFNPFYLKRKADKWNSNPRDQVRNIDSIEFDKIQKTVCIATESPDESYVTENFIVTHNTHIGIEVMRIVQKTFGGKCLIVTELGAAETFINADPEVGEGARLGVKLEYVTNQKEAFENDCNIVVTNYERVRTGEFDFFGFTGVWLDEGNYIKNMASETTNMLQKQLKKVRFKYIATATPSPNETLELVNYAHVLDISDRGQILTRFFQRNSVKAGELTLFPQHENDFWMWVSSWAVFIQLPSDMGYDDEGYKLPPLNVHWHEVSLNKAIEGRTDRYGQKEMFVTGSASLPDAAKIKRLSIKERLSAALGVMKEYDEKEHWILWHSLEDERKAINRVFKDVEGYADVFGNLHWREKERRIVAFSKGELSILATKPEINGVGCNFQKHCHLNILLGVNHSFDEFYQLMKRTHRYGATLPVEVHVFYTPEEYDIVNNLKRKWDEHDATRAKMREIMLTYGLNHKSYAENKHRSFAENRKVYKGDNYTLINNDCVYEFKKMEDNSVDMILTSIPFGNHYEYTDKYNDFGHNSTNKEFFEQMDYLVPELLRVLKPGRIAAIHTKNRIHYGSVTGLGFSTFHRFSHATCDCFERNGFFTMGFHFIPTDVVAENNQTYRLGFGEMKKDSTKMGSGIPEEIWIFRKAPSSNDNAYADVPVTADKYYSLSNWQLDADAFWKSNGNTYLLPHQLKQWGLDRLQAWWKKFDIDNMYDYDQHVKLLEDLDKQGKLSRTFTTTPLQTNSNYVWENINRMRGLNMEQSKRKQRSHICPMAFDEVDRLLIEYSNEGDLIADPFGGIGTTGVRAIKHNRRVVMTELNETYAKCASIYLHEEEFKTHIPTLFDAIKDMAI